MTTDTRSTRRTFLKQGGLVAAPLAAAPAAALADGASQSRAARLQDEAAVRALHQAWLRRVNTGEDAAALFADPRRTGLGEAVKAVGPDHAAAGDAIAVAEDGRTASGRFHCLVEIETEIPEDCTLAQMAHAQGGGRVRRTERRLLTAAYVKAAGAWAISKLGFA